MLNNFGEYAVRELTRNVLAVNYPEYIFTYFIEMIERG